MTSNTLDDFTQNQYKASLKRLLLKTARYIGKSCHDYLSSLLEPNLPLSLTEMEILERILSMGLYSDQTIERACITALSHEITSVVEFNFAVCDIGNQVKDAD